LGDGSARVVVGGIVNGPAHALLPRNPEKSSRAE